MRNAKRSAVISLIACYIAVAVVIALAVLAHRLFQMYYIEFRGMTDPASIRLLRRSLAICVYPGCVLGLVSLMGLIRMLYNILAGNVFIMQNVRILRMISWCCILVAVLTLWGAYFYLPLCFVAAAAVFLGIILRVVKNVLQSAVALREENDLTI